MKDNAPQMAAALSYYALFAIPPILLITLSLLNIFLADVQSQATVIETVQRVIGENGTVAVVQVMEHLDAYSNQSSIAQWAGIIMLLIAATGVGVHLQRSLNTLWDTDTKPHHSLLFIIRQRFVSFLFLLVMGVILLLLFIINTLLNFLGAYISETLGISAFVLDMGNISISFVAVIIFIALIFKYVPEGAMSWRDVFVGSLVTAFLFVLGRYVIGLYLNMSTIGSAYGAAGSILLLLVWIYYTALIFFFGAEFTQVFATVHGNGIASRKPSVSSKKYE